MESPSIRRVHLHPFHIPLSTPLRIAIGEVWASAGVLVRIEVNEELVGLGEAAPLPVINGETQGSCLAIGRELAPRLIGRDPRAVATRIRELDQVVPGNACIKAAFDMALWDLQGKMAGMPVYRLLGGDVAEVPTDQTVSIGSLEQMTQRAVRVRDAGFGAVKLKVGGPRVEDDVAKVAAVREAIGPAMDLRVDANQGWDVPTAVRALRAMEPYRIQFAEQPVARHDLEGLRAVRRAVSIPVMADESVFRATDALRLARMDAVDHLNIKLMKSGGITEAVRIGDVARAAGLRCMVGCMVESRIAIAAAAHFAAACDVVTFADLDGYKDFEDDPVVGGPQEKGGRLQLPPRPGLGVSLRSGFLRELETFTIE